MNLRACCFATASPSLVLLGKLLSCTSIIVFLPPCFPLTSADRPSMLSCCLHHKTSELTKRLTPKTQFCQDDPDNRRPRGWFQPRGLALLFCQPNARKLIDQGLTSLR